MLYLIDGRPIAYNMCPVGYMVPSVKQWVEDGRTAPNSFIAHLVADRLRQTVEKADEANRAALIQWIRWFYFHAPSGCCGSEAEAKGWADHHGLAGARAKNAALLAMKRVHYREGDGSTAAPVFEAPGIGTDELWTWEPTSDRLLQSADRERVRVGDVIYRGKPLGE